MTKAKLKAAIYTRKSTTHGLEQEFNSLQAQREAGEAYITSQKSQGWVIVDKAYDDGGVSGGTMVRPALQELLSDVKNGLVDIIVVYKVDRLTRKLSDFAQIIETLDASEASFVSVTQQFNTSSSMGRLTLNVLLSFAQFEREVTAERIRDKMLASKKKGMWMGGALPLGYDAVDKKLVINEEEAVVVRGIFSQYLKTKSMTKLIDKVYRLGYRTKKRSGMRPGGIAFKDGPLYYILKNSIYIGEISHYDQRYIGQHEAIIDTTTWHQTQVLLELNRQKERLKVKAGYPSLLTGIIYHDNGSRLTPSHAEKNGKRYRYYLAHKNNPETQTQYYTAELLENDVKNTIITWLDDDTKHAATVEKALWLSFMETLKFGTPHQQKEKLLELVTKITIKDAKMCIEINLGALLDEEELDEDELVHMLEAKVHFKHKSTKTIIPSGKQQIQLPNQKLIQMIAKAHLWAKGLQSGDFKTMTALAEKHGVDKADIGKNVRLAYLAPDIVHAILEGRQPPSLNANKLRRMSDLPANWDQQRKTLGFH